MASGGIMWMHGGHVGKANGGGWMFLVGLAGGAVHHVQLVGAR